MLHSLDEKVTLEQAERQARLLAQMDSLYVGSTELNERMNSMVSEFERENNERLTARYKAFVLERDNSYYMVAGLALAVSLLAIMLYTVIHRDLNRRLRYERELEQSDKRNRELLRSRKELMVSVVHDLRAPLAAIRGCAEQLPSESDGSRRAGYLDNILHSSDYMLGLVNTLMEYHRMDEGGGYSKATLFNLKTLFEEIADGHRLAARQKKLVFTASFSGLDVIVSCDSSHIRQIVGNLLSNALKFTFHWKVLLEAEYRQGNLRISVLDTGMGIGLEEKNGYSELSKGSTMRVIFPVSGWGWRLRNGSYPQCRAMWKWRAYPVKEAVSLFSCLCRRPGNPSVQKKRYFLPVNCPLVSVCWSLTTTVFSWESSVKCSSAIRFTVTVARMSGN